MKNFLIITLTIFAAASLLSLQGCDSPDVASAKRAVAEGLRDPDSAKFRDIYKGPGALCGEVNAKNAFGAMVGFRRFYSDPAGITDVEQSEDKDLKFGRAYACACYDKEIREIWDRQNGMPKRACFTDR